MPPRTGRRKHLIVWTRKGLKAHLAVAGVGRTVCGVRYTPPGDTAASAREIFLVGLCENCRTQLLDAEVRRRSVRMALVAV